MSGWLPMVIVAAVLIALLIWAARPRYQMRIVVHNGSVERFEGLPRGHAEAIAEFIERDLELAGHVTILGNRRPGGNLHLAIRGPVDDGTRQRIRNFLLTVL